MVQPGDHLAETEKVARSAIFPKFFRESNPANGFAPEQLLDFQKVDKKDRTRLATSVAWTANLDGPDAVHGYGCRIAEKKNEFYAEKKKQSPAPLVSRCHYLGYYELGLAALGNLQTEAHSVYVEYQPEHGENSHCNMWMVQRDPLPDGADPIDSRTTVISRIWRALIGPMRAICPCDAEWADELSQIELKSPK